MHEFKTSLDYQQDTVLKERRSSILHICVQALNTLPSPVTVTGRKAQSAGQCCFQDHCSDCCHISFLAMLAFTRHWSCSEYRVFWVKVSQRPFDFLLTLKETTCLYFSSQIFLPTLEHKGSPWTCIHLWGSASTRHYKCWGRVSSQPLALKHTERIWLWRRVWVYCSCQMAIGMLLSFLVNPVLCLGRNTSVGSMLAAAINLCQGLLPSAWNKMIINSRNFEIEIWSTSYVW